MEFEFPAHLRGNAVIDVIAEIGEELVAGDH
jgi:hypothetical protein